MIYKPLSQRSGLENGVLAFVRDTVYESSRPMGNVAMSNLEFLISATLVGLYDQISGILPNLCAWMDEAMKNHEDFGESQDFHQEQLHWARAIGSWLGDKSSAKDLWRDAMHHHQAAYANDPQLFSAKDRSTDALDDYMAFSFQSGSYEQGVIEYERFYGSGSVSPKGALKPRQLAYLYCINHLDAQFDTATLLAAGRRMLRANLQDKWLGGGQFIRAATWLKIVYGWLDENVAPKDI